MTDTTTQAAAQTTNTPAAPGVEGTGAQAQQTADLDSILAEFDQSTKPAPAPAPAQAAAPPQVVDVEARKELAEMKFQQEIKPVLQRVRGDIPKEALSDEEIQDLLDGRARREPRLKQAWIDRATNPAAWSKVEKALQQELQKKFSKLPDPGATEDREAVTAAVRGASSKSAPDEKPPSWGSMTEGEFLQERRARYGF